VGGYGIFKVYLPKLLVVYYK